MRIIYKSIIIILIIIGILSVGLSNVNNRILVHNTNTYYLITMHTGEHLDLVTREVGLIGDEQAFRFAKNDTEKEKLNQRIIDNNLKLSQINKNLSDLVIQINDEKNKEIWWYPIKNILSLIILFLTLVNAILGIIAVASEKRD